MTYLKDTDLAARYDVDRVTIHRWRKGISGFPQPVKLTPGTTRWLLSDIEAWEAERIAQATA